MTCCVRRVSVALVTITIVTGAASGQSAAGGLASRLHPGFAVGITNPIGELGDLQSVGFHAGALVIAEVHDRLNARVEGIYHRLGNQENGNITSQRNILSGLVDAQWSLAKQGASARPYALAGAGMYRISLSTVCTSSCQFVDTNPPESNTKVGYSLGLGVTFHAATSAVLVEVRWHTIPKATAATEDKAASAISFIPISFGLILW
jgi:opacity protein-like surface antigen